MRILFLLALCCLMAGNAPAANDAASTAADFDQANRLYEQGKFPEAVAAYQRLVGTGAGTASLWFNLGNAAYKSGQFGRAIAAYRQAELLDPRNPALRANLQFVRGKVYSDERVRMPAWKNLTRLATVNEWTGLAVIFFWAGFALLAYGQWRRRSAARLAGLAFLLFALTGLGAAAAYRDTTTPQAVVVAKEATVRFGPIEESQSAFQLRDGAELSVLDTKGDWLNVRDPEQRVGWIRRDATAQVSGL